jgi:hypothetical protein
MWTLGKADGIPECVSGSFRGGQLLTELEQSSDETDSVTEDASGHNISRKFYHNELMELQSLDSSCSQPPHVATTPGAKLQTEVAAQDMHSPSCLLCAHQLVQSRWGCEVEEV